MGGDRIQSQRGARFRAVMSALREEIQRGQWPAGSRLPAEPELARRYGVGINTVRRAVAFLVDDGIVARRHGSGTYVLDSFLAMNVVDPSGAPSKQNIVGAVLPTAEFYHPELVGGIESACSDRGVRLMIAYADYSPMRELVRARELAAAGVAGLILSPSFHRMSDPESYLDAIDELGLPYVFVERKAPTVRSARISVVRSDTFAAGVAAAQHLIGLGRRRLALVGIDGRTTAPDLRNGFLAGLADARCADPVIDLRSDWSRLNSEAFTRRTAAERIDGLFCVDDRVGVTVMPLLRERGLSVPDDVSVIAYDNNVAEYAEVPLTALAPPKRQVGSTAADVLLKSVLTDPEPRPVAHIDLVPQLVVRQSCGAEIGSNLASASIR